MLLGAKAPCADEAGAHSIPWILRVGVAACFIGHGMLGVMRVAAWTSYFAVVGIGHDTALTLMPLVGALDIAMGLLALFHPMRGLIVYMAAWCIWTAILRPLAGESFWEAVERAGNYGAPLALLVFLSVCLWTRKGRENPEAARASRLAWILRLTTVMLLFGHGALGWLVHKPILSTQYNAIGLPGATVEPLIGMFECLLALAVLVKPSGWLLVGVLVWKLATEALSPMAGSSIWVFIEHGGSYAAPLALALLLARRTPGDVGIHTQLPVT